MADRYKQMLEMRAEIDDSTPKGKALRMELERRIADYNAALSYNRQETKPYIIPGEFNLGGWVKGEQPYKQYVTMPSGRAKDEELADTVAHEGFHRRRYLAGSENEKQPAIFGGDPVGRGALGHPDARMLMRLNELLRAQKTYPTPVNYNEGAEETYATYSGIEGRLPKGTAITSLPEFAEIAQNQKLKNLLFSETSVPYGGVWEGQTDDQKVHFSPLDGIKALIGQVTQAAQQPKQNVMQLIGKLIGTR